MNVTLQKKMNKPVQRLVTPVLNPLQSYYKQCIFSIQLLLGVLDAVSTTAHFGSTMPTAMPLI